MIQLDTGLQTYEDLEAILVLGPPGSGKDIQSESLPKTRFYHFSSGKMYTTNAELKKRMGEHIAQGNLGPDNLTVEYFFKEIDDAIHQGVYIPGQHFLALNGIPRSVPQIGLIEPRINVSAAIFLDIPDDEIARRIDIRRKVNLSQEGKMRADDDDPTGEKLLKRLSEYNTKTVPAINIYKEKLGHRFVTIPFDPIMNNKPMLESIAYNAMRVGIALGNLGISY